MRKITQAIVKPSYFKEGQILLITLLVLVVAATVVLSLIGRATLDLTISNQIEESARAFNAAEAGIEEAFRSGVGSGGAQVLAPGVTYDVSVAAIGGQSGVYPIPRKTPQGVTETVWLVNHNDDGSLDETPRYTANTLDMCWSKESTTPALVVSVLYKEGTNGTYQVARVALDPDAASRGNNFDSAVVTSNGCGLGNYYEKQINFTSLGISLSGANRDTLLALRLRPEYADTMLAFETAGGATLPKQGNRIESVGTTQTGVTRKVVVYQQYRAASAIFDAVIYSQSSFSH